MYLVSFITYYTFRSRLIKQASNKCNKTSGLEYNVSHMCSGLVSFFVVVDYFYSKKKGNRLKDKRGGGEINDILQINAFPSFHIYWSAATLTKEVTIA